MGQAARSSKRSWRRIVAWAAAVAAILIVIAGAGLWFGRLALIERALTDLLAEQGFSDVDFVVSSASTTGVVLRDVRLGGEDGLRAARISVRFTLGGLTEGTVEAASFEGLRAALAIDEDGYSLGPLDPLLQGGGGQPSGAFPKLPPIRIADARIAVTSPFGDADLVGDAVVTAPDGGLAMEAALTIETGIGSLPTDVTFGMPSDGNATGRLVLKPVDLAVSVAQLAGLEGTVDLAMQAGAARPNLKATFAAAAVMVDDLPVGPGQVRFDFDGTLLQLRASLGDDSAAARIEATLEPFASPMTAVLTGSLTLAAAAPLGDKLGVPVPGPATLDMSLAVTGNPVAASGDLTIAARVEDIAEDAMTAKSVSLELQTPIDIDLDRVVVGPVGDGHVLLDALTIEDRLAFDEPLTLVLEASDRPGLIARFNDARGPRYDIDLALLPSDFIAELTDAAGKRRRLTGQTPRIGFSGTSGPSSFAGLLSIDAGRVRSAAERLELIGIGGRVPVLVPDSDARYVGEFWIDRIRHGGAEATMAPPRLEFRVDREESRYDVEGRLRDPAGRYTVDLTASHDQETETGKASARLRKVTFDPTDLVPEALFPGLAGLLTKVTGSLAFTTRSSWSPKGRRQRLQLLVEDLSAEIEGIALQRVNTVLAFDIGGRRTSPVQEIAIGALDLGVLLTDGLVTLRVDPKGRLFIDEMGWTFSGGRVFAKDLVVDPAAERQELMFRVEGVQFEQLVAAFELDGVSATGELAGELPVTIVGGDFAISDGLLQTSAPGSLRYTPEQYPAGLDQSGEGVGLALQALQNFEYESLRLTLNRGVEGEAVLKLHLRGKNPDLYSGYPIAFNLSLSGKLDQIITQGLEGYRVPEKIRKKMLNFAK